MNSLQTFVLAALFGVAIQGAIALPVAAATDEELLLVTIPSSAVVLHASVSHDGGKNQIRGHALRKSANKSATGGHIDFEAFSPSGKSILVERVALVPTPLPRRAHGRSSFYWQLSDTVPQGSRVELRYHAGAHAAASTRKPRS